VWETNSVADKFDCGRLCCTKFPGILMVIKKDKNRKNILQNEGMLGFKDLVQT